MSSVEMKLHGAIARIEIDNPPVNALSEAVLQGLGGAIGDAEAVGARVVLLTSTGTKAFAAGADLSELEHLLGSPEAAASHVALTDSVFGAIRSCPIPVVVALHANAVGGGLELALACDVIVAEDHVRLGLPESSLGLIPGAGGTQQLTHIVGPVLAKKLLMFGSLLTAAEAHAIGLVSEVCADGAAIERATELASRLATGSPASLAAIKRVVHEGVLHPDRGAEAERAEFLQLLQGEDAQEGCAAFLSKRRPSFGRLPERS
ncbi:MAG: enoyl-CoA hydratase/isomerase family protein [Microthrixaceae bacterium]